jgi:hypothetical protein
MKKLILAFITTTIYFVSSAQFVATMEVKEPIQGVCNAKGVYVLFPGFKGQEEAVCPLSKEDILKKLDAEVNYLQDKPDYNDKGMIGLIINCKGELVQCKMDNKTKDPVLDAQIETVFKSLGEWKAGKLKRRAVDTSKLFSFKIVNGKFTF